MNLRDKSMELEVVNERAMPTESVEGEGVEEGSESSSPTLTVDKYVKRLMSLNRRVSDDKGGNRVRGLQQVLLTPTGEPYKSLLRTLLVNLTGPTIYKSRDKLPIWIVATSRDSLHQAYHPPPTTTTSSPSDPFRRTRGGRRSFLPNHCQVKFLYTPTLSSLKSLFATAHLSPLTSHPPHLILFPDFYRYRQLSTSPKEYLNLLGLIQLAIRGLRSRTTSPVHWLILEHPPLPVVTTPPSVVGLPWSQIRPSLLHFFPTIVTAQPHHSTSTTTTQPHLQLLPTLP